MTAFFRTIVEMHKETFDPSEIRDVVDTYLLEIETAKLENRDMDLMYHGKDPGKEGRFKSISLNKAFPE
jgi:26-hydroxylase